MTNIRNNKGIVLFIVIATIFIVIILANVIIGLIQSQSRLTHHQVSRIQAYYADWGGINYTYDKLRRGEWPMPGTTDWDNLTQGNNFYQKKLCNPNGPTSNPKCGSPRSDCDIPDEKLPCQVKEVIITIAGTGYNPEPGNPKTECKPPSTGIPLCISSTGTYTYRP